MNDTLRIDLHVHSTRSPDSHLPLEVIAARAAYAGLRGFALTDHNTVEGHREIPALRSRHPELFIVPGVEVSTREGHLLAYGLSECPPSHRPVVETIEWIRARGGEPVLAHPFRFTHGVGRRVGGTAPVRAIEIRNGHNSETQNLRAELLAARRALGGTGGSDAHELGDLGRAYTEFATSARSIDDLLEQLRKGTTRGDGHSLALPGRIRWGLRTGLLRLGRGLRPV